jgi:hypothetical protein
MRRITLRVAAVAVVVLAAAASTAVADRAAPAPLVGVHQEARIAPTRGFVDDAIAAEGTRLAYVNTDAATFTELVVYDVAAGAEKLRAALPGDLGTPVELHLVDHGRVLVIGRTTDGTSRGVLVGPDGKTLRHYGPAHDLALVERRGAPRIAVHQVSQAAGGVTRHQVELVDLATGRRIGKTRTLEVDGHDACKKLDFQIAYWTDGYTHAVGTKGGHYDPKEDQRTPDAAGDLDVLTRSFKVRAISDPMEHQRRLNIMHGRSGQPSFARMSNDLSAVEVWKAGVPTTLTLDQPVLQYDPTTLASSVDDHGHVWVGLVVDPVNVEAVHRKKADPPYLDLYRVDGARAVRKARVLAPAKRKLSWGVAGDRWWVLERNVGFDRGGPVLTIYKLGA